MNIPISKDAIKKAIESLNDSTLGYLELMNDRMFNRIPADCRRQLVDIATNTGKMVAEKIIDEAKTSDPLSIAKYFGIEVVVTHEDNIMGKFLTHSEYIPPATICIYEHSVVRLRKLIVESGLEDFFPANDVMAFHVAHELFHHIEKTRIGHLSEKYAVETARWGPFRIKSRIRALSEIAAHAFAKTLLGAQVSPKLLDYIITDEKARSFFSNLESVQS